MQSLKITHISGFIIKCTHFKEKIIEKHKAIFLNKGLEGKAIKQHISDFPK